LQKGRWGMRQKECEKLSSPTKASHQTQKALQKRTIVVADAEKTELNK